MRRFETGEVIVQRHFMWGALMVAWPLVVVSDTGDVLATYLPIGTRTFGPIFENRANAIDEVRAGTMKLGERTWHSNDALMLVRPDDPYCVMGFWNEARTFVGWYVNLQDPMRRTEIGFDSGDHTLDLIVGEDLASYMWKDEHELEAAVELGLYTADEAAAFRRNGEAVVELVRTGRTWWGGWRDFVPDPSWPVPALPDGWDAAEPG